MRKNYQSFVNYDQSRTWKAVSGDYVGKGDIDYSFIRLIDETIIERKRFDDDGNLLSKYHTFKDRTVLRIRRAADSDFIELFCTPLIKESWKDFSIEVNKDSEPLEYIRIKMTLKPDDSFKETSKLVMTKRHCAVIKIHMDLVAEVSKLTERRVKTK